MRDKDYYSLAFVGLEPIPLTIKSMTGIKGKSGGKRKGSGRKQKFKEPTKPMRIPISLVPKVEKMMEQLQKKKARKKPDDLEWDVYE
jgi:hypothetical protein